MRVLIRYRNDKDRTFAIGDVALLDPPDEGTSFYTIEFESGLVTYIESAVVGEIGTANDEDKPA